MYNSDATTTDTLRKNSLHPIYLSLGNIPTWRRNKKDAKQLLGYFPILFAKNKTEKESSDFKKLACKTFHDSIKFLLDPLFQGDGGVDFKIDGKDVWFFSRISIIICDWPEACTFSLTYKSANSNYPCHFCLVQKEDLINIRKDQLILRDHVNMKEYFNNGTSNSAGLEQVDNYFWNIPNLNIYMATVPDRMHHLDLGLFKYQIEFTTELLKLKPGKLVDDINKRIAKIPRHSGLKVFKKGMQSLSRLTASEYRDMMKIMVFVVDGLYSEDLSNVYVKWNEMYLLSRLENFKESDLQDFQQSMIEVIYSLSRDPRMIDTESYEFSELHYGPYSSYWWLVSNEDQTIFPIRLGQKVKVCLNNEDFFITVQFGSGNTALLPVYCCQCGLHVVSEASPTKAISTAYKYCFNTYTRYSGYQIIGWKDKDILENLKKNVQFTPVNINIGNKNIFIYSIGVSSYEKWCYAGSGFQVSLINTYEKKQSIFVSRFEDKKCIVEIYQESILKKQFIGKTPNEQHKIPKYTLNDWNNENILQQLFNYHVKRRTITSVDWKFFFKTWNESENPVIELELSLCAIYPSGYEFSERELVCQIQHEHFGNVLNMHLHVGRNTILESRKHARNEDYGAPILVKPVINKQRFTPEMLKQIENFLNDKEFVNMSSYKTNIKTGKPILYLQDTKKALWERFSEEYPNGIRRTSFMTCLEGGQYVYRENLGGLCSMCNNCGYMVFGDIEVMISAHIMDNNLKKQLLRQSQELRRYIRRQYSKELEISLDGVVIHNSCISHCIRYAFGACNLDHPITCSKCENLFHFFDELKDILSEQYSETLDEYKQKLIAWMAHHAHKTYLNIHVRTNLEELDGESAVIIVDYKMKILPQSARETKAEFFDKRGWSLHSVLVYTKNIEQNQMNVQTFDHWSDDTRLYMFPKLILNF
ncbi:hypothetical protein Glove_470g6 [Diversispora epigaea]|uniref:Uncharacterized protein n=1 Tax=Diversispora epigaea TaxID=1348612 RepID=A0A397GQG9_9GLOM|nr:hypothetical protein Glove_470g4 [Diversispora epigaea]RHZ51764.1 hypothetical protein Glove_470g6 [Diversispora epigaea]